ncbi:MULTISPECIES: hypothetical protein [unclassified Beijerinckia]|uniref:hypothetical protein n=1 Tax=unclassified Beijerinckia TaxID=2638183 RepID=UPI0011148223|nr:MULTISPECIES: hypothetical protein [unclassified Beijerinckia]
MTSNLPMAQVDEHDFEAIEAAVMETARGRWFLTEYARRMRAAETTKVLEAITRLERSFAIDKAKQATDGPLGASELTEAVALIERRLSEIAWSLRERGFDGRTCTEIENQARALRQLTGAVPAPVAPSIAAAPAAPVIAPALAPVAAAPVSQPIAPSTRPPAAVAARTMSSIARLNTRLAEIRQSGTVERAGTSDAASFAGRALRSLAEIDAMDDRARARLFS